MNGRLFRIAVIVLVSGLFPVVAQDTPMSEKVPEGKVTTITCSLGVPPRHSDVPVFYSEKDARVALGTYHYNVWLPEGYDAAPQKRWPTLFVMNYGGNASMGFAEAVIREKGMICIMLVEAKNGPWEPIVGNFLAAHDDAVKRFRIKEGEKIATGVSGGARGSSVFAQIRPGFRGVILQAAGGVQNKGKYMVRSLRKMHVAMTMGTKDSNRFEAAQLGKELPRAKYRVFEFDGGHSWAPESVFRQALEWMMAEGKVPPEKRSR